MFDVLTVREVKAAEARAAVNGLNQDVLIENAAAALKATVCALTKPQDKIAVLCGGGNNGADGLSLARQLHLAGRAVTVVYTARTMGEAAAARQKACRALGVPECDAQAFRPQDFAFIVDAMLGTGCNRPLDGVVRDLVQKLNDGDTYVLAADMPTGLNADTGETDLAVIADQTVTFSCVKAGQIVGEGRNCCGTLTVADIGVRGEGATKVVTGDDLPLLQRRPVSHKYHYGRVRVIAGSPTMIGAALLAHESAAAALRSGAGLATLCVPASLKAAYQGRAKEETLCFLPDVDGKILLDKDSLDALFVKTGAILIGPGMGENDRLFDIIEYIKDNFAGTLVLDADALNAVAGRTRMLREHKGGLILTPHMGEFARLTQGMFSDPFISVGDKVRALAEDVHAVVAAKSATTVISDGNGVYLNVTGTPALAKGGSGDVLGGMVAAFACRYDPLAATLRACYHFGKCAEVAEKLYGAESLLAEHIIVKK